MKFEKSYNKNISEYESDLRNNEYYLSGCKIRSEEQKFQDYTGFELMASAIPIQCPAN